MAAVGNMTIWMHLRNAREVIGGLRSTAAATGLLGTSTDRLSRHLAHASRRTWLMNQALFTLRRYSYMATLGLTAGIAVVAKWGFSYLSQVQEATVAFHKFGLTNLQVKNEIKDLYRIAAISPFLFTDITGAARRFLAFGMDVKTANLTVTNLADALTALGLATGASMNRASLALSHMFSLGRVTGQIVYQLARDNVPIIQALEKELHLTADQLRRVGTLGIPASVAIQALNKYIADTPRFHNAALIFATKTWRGIITTTRDYMAQFMGKIEQPLFLRLQRGARKFLLWLTSNKVDRAFNQGGIAGILGLVSPNAARVWRMFAQTLTAVWRIFTGGLIPAFRYVAEIALPTIVIALWPTITALKFLGRHAWLTRILFGFIALELGFMAARMAILLPLWTAMLVKTIVANALTRIGIMLRIVEIRTIDLETGEIIKNNVAKTKSFLILGKVGRGLWAMIKVTKAGIFWTRLYTVATKGAIRGDNGRFVAMTRLEKMMFRVRLATLRLIRVTKAYSAAILQATKRMIVFLLTDPIGWAILLAAALVILYFRWKRFHDAVNKFAHWIYTHPLAQAFIPIIGPLLTIYHLMRRIVALAGQLRHPLNFAPHIGIPHGGKGWLHALGRWALTPSIPGLALGGNITSGGLAMVGEHGREIVDLPRGARVSPLKRAGATGDLSHITIEFYNHSTLEVDGEKMAENVSKHRLDAHARR